MPTRVTSSYERALLRLLEVTSSPRLGLSRMESLLGALGNPHHRFEVIHIAGTNGKGSTLAFVSAMLTAASIPFGCTSSPHLMSARERIVVDGAMVTEDSFVDLEKRVYEAASTLDDAPTFYERMVAMAFCAFAQARVPLAVVEVGLGGRFDATNVVRPRVCGITRIGLDHTQFLGDTLDAIAREKAGIIKRGIAVVVAPQDFAAEKEIVDVACEQGAPVAHAQLYENELGLKGAHQKENAGVALELIRHAGIALSESDLARALSTATWPGRLESLIFQERRIVLDGAHNVDAARALAAELRAHERDGFCLLVGSTRGHGPKEFAAAFVEALGDDIALLRKVVATQARAPRSLPAQEVATAWDSVLQTLPYTRGARSDVVGVEAKDIDVALAHATGPDERASLVVTGSLYLVGEVRSQMVPMPTDPVLPDF